jgi:hypothetical protein
MISDCCHIKSSKCLVYLEREALHSLIYYTTPYYTILHHTIQYSHLPSIAYRHLAHDDDSMSRPDPRLLWDDHPQTILAGQKPPTPGPRSCGSRVSRDEGAQAAASSGCQERDTKPYELEGQTLAKVCLPRPGHWRGLIWLDARSSAEDDRSISPYEGFIMSEALETSTGLIIMYILFHY